MATIVSLPAELVSHIISLAYPCYSDDRGVQRGRREFLRAAALVCREWTSPAQQALWKVMELGGMGVVTLDSVIAAGVGRYPVQSLRIDMRRQQLPNIAAILGTVRGVRNLTLVGNVMQVDWLCGSNLRGLKTLQLQVPTLASDGSADPPIFPFALTTLRVRCGDGGSSPLDALFRQPSITTLHCLSPLKPIDPFERFSSLEGQLQTLVFERAQVHAVETDDFLARCTQLKHLTLPLHHIPSLHHVVTSLESLTLLAFSATDVGPLLKILTAKKVAIAGLKELNLLLHASEGKNPRPPMSKVQSWGQWSSVAKVCEEMKIKVIVGTLSGY